MDKAFDRALARLTGNAVSFTVHEHTAAHTVADARERLPFPVERFLKTIAFKVKTGGYILACLRGMDRVDYRRLAVAGDSKRADIVQLSPGEVAQVFEVEAGSVGPLVTPRDAQPLQVLFDEQVPTNETLFCGIGLTDRTLEIGLNDLVPVTQGRIAPIAKMRPSGAC